MSEIRYETTPAAPAPEHELAKLFPLLEGDARQRLKDDIAANGVIEPIVFLGDRILDGRNRYYLARELGIAYPRIQYEGDDPVAFVLSRNLHRRHLTESQRATAAAKIAKLPRGANQHTEISASSPTQAQAAEMLNVSVDSVQSARKVIERGVPELVTAVEAGKVSVSAASEVASLPPDEQDEVVAQGIDAVKEEARRLREERRQERLAAQAENDRLRDEARAALPQSVQAQQAAKERAIAARESSAPDGLTPEQRIAELEEAVRTLEAENAELKASAAKWEPMQVQWEQGGFEAVVAGKDEQIRVLRTQVETESHDKAAWKRRADTWRDRAVESGWSNEITIPLEDADG